MSSARALQTEPRRGQRASVLVATAWLLVLVGANMPTPLYLVYERRFHFGSAEVTLIFATYALVLVPSLLVFGQLSDRFGRRVVIVSGLGFAALGLLLFAFAQGSAWLFAARAVQGLSVGTLAGAANAALVELQPHRDTRRAALPAGLAQAGGSAGGALVAGVLAQYAPAPTALCFMVALAATVACAAAVMATAEPARSRGGRWRVQRPNVPRALRTLFAQASLTAAVVWSVAALFLSVVPEYAGRLLGSQNLALLAALSALMLLSSTAAQVAVGRLLSPAAGEAVGLIALTAGLGALVLAFPAHSLPLLVVAAVLAGSGHGIAFLAAQGDLNGLAPDDQRGEVSAAFYMCIYLGVALPVIGTGVVTLFASLFTAVVMFAAVVGAAALGNVAWLAVRSTARAAA